MSQYSAHYKNLHNDELVDRALRGDLVAEAEEALRRELKARGISDLSTEIKARALEAEQEERHVQQQLAHRAKVWRWRTSFLYIAAGLVFIWGLVLYLTFDPSRSTEDGGLLMMGSLVLVIFGYVSHRVAKARDEKVLFRRPR